MAFSGLNYIKNVGKSFGYVAIDTVKKYNPAFASVGRQAKEISEDITTYIREVKEGRNSATNEVNDVLGTTWKDFWKNAKEDLLSGKLYNKERINSYNEEASNEMMKSFGLDMDDFNFDFDDAFGDISEDDSSSSEVKAERESGEMNVRATIASANMISKNMDVVGGRVANTINKGTAKSIDYLARVYTKSSGAIISGMNSGFSETLKGLTGINTGINSLVALSDPLVSHMQNSANFYTKSSEFQGKALDLLKQIAENTKKGDIAGTVKKNDKLVTIEDLIDSEGGILDVKSYFNMVKNNVKDTIEFATELMSLMGGAKNVAKTHLTASPLTFMVEAGIAAVIPTALKDSMKLFNGMMQDAFTTMLGNLRNASTGDFFFDLIKDIFLPGTKFQKDIDTGNYNKGPVPWDGKARKALIEVIPEQLSKIIAILTNSKDLDKYDYDKGKWLTKSKIDKDYKDKLKSSARYNTSDFTYLMEDTLKYLAKEGKISKKESEAMKEEILNFLTKTISTGSNKFTDVTKRNAIYDDSIKKDLGLSEASFNFIQDLLSAAEYGTNAKGERVFKKDLRSNLDASLYRAIEQIGVDRRTLSAKGDAAILSTINGSGIENNKIGSLHLGLLEYKDVYQMSVMDYLRGIYINTFYGGGKGKRKGGKGPKLPYGPMPAPGFKSEADKSNIESVIGEYTSGMIDEDSISQATYATDSIMGSLSAEAKKYFEEKNRFTNNGKDADMVEEWESSDKYNEEYEKEYNKKSGLRKLADDLKKKFKDNKYVKAIADMFDTVGKAFEKPMDALTKMFNSLSKNMSDFIHGQDENEEKMSIGGFLYNLIRNPREALSRLWNENIKTSDIYKGAKKTFGDAGKWIGKNIFGFEEEKKSEEEKVENAAKGRYITKSGVITVSEGEMVIPSELNPYYRGITNKKHQIANEQRITNKYLRHLGNYAEGTETPFDEVMKNLNETSKSEINSLWDLIKASAATLGYSVMDIAKESKLGAKKIGDKIKQSSLDIIFKLFPEAKKNAGSMLAGAVMGLGGSLLTGGILSPILAAGLGSAIALGVRSEEVKDTLFGKEDENTGERSGGALGNTGKKIWDFIKKHGKDMGVGAIAGTIGGTVLAGSPVAGLFIGSALGFAKGSKEVKDYLFGEIIGTDENGNDIRKNTGIFSTEVQKLVKKRLPHIGAGAMAGLIVGPFNPLLNLLVGSAVGFASDTEKVKDFLFGKVIKDKDGNEIRRGGMLGYINEEFLRPAKGIFEKLVEETRHLFRGLANTLSKKLKDMFSGLADWFRTSPLANFIQSTLFGKMLKGIASVAASPLKLVSGLLKGTNEALEKRALKRGYNLRGADGKLLSAAERSTLRARYGIGVGDRYDLVDNLVAKSSSEQLDELRNQLVGLKDERSKSWRDIESGKSSIDKALKRGISQNKSYISGGGIVAVINNYVRKNQFDKAIEAVNSTPMNENTRKELLDLIDEQSKLVSSKDELKDKGRELNKAFGGKIPWKELDNGTIDNMLDSIKNQKNLLESKTPQEKTSENVNEIKQSVVETLPKKLDDLILSILYPDEARNNLSLVRGLKGLSENIKKDAVAKSYKKVKAAHPEWTAQQVKAYIDGDIDEDGKALTARGKILNAKANDKGRKEGDEWDENGDHMIFHDGRAIKKEDYLQDRSFKQILIDNVPFVATISNGITNFTNTLKNIKDFFLGNKDEGKESIFTKIKHFLFGKDGELGAFGKVINFFKDGSWLTTLKDIGTKIGDFALRGIGIAGTGFLLDLIINGDKSAASNAIDSLAKKITDALRIPNPFNPDNPEGEEGEEGEEGSEDNKNKSNKSNRPKASAFLAKQSYDRTGYGRFKLLNARDIMAGRLPTVINALGTTIDLAFGGGLSSFRNLNGGNIVSTGKQLLGEALLEGGETYANNASVFAAKNLLKLNSPEAIEKAIEQSGKSMRELGEEELEKVLGQSISEFTEKALEAGAQNGIKYSKGPIGQIKKKIFEKMKDYLIKHPEKISALSIGLNTISSVIAGLDIAQLLFAFTEGFQSPSVWLKIRQSDIKTSDRLVSGLLATLYQALCIYPAKAGGWGLAFSAIFSMVFSKASFVELIVNNVISLVGTEQDKLDYAMRQKRAEIELNTYKERNGIQDMDWDQYSHEVLHNYNVTETYGNIFKSSINELKAGGIKGYLTSGFGTGEIIKSALTSGGAVNEALLASADKDDLFHNVLDLWMTDNISSMQKLGPMLKNLGKAAISGDSSAMDSINSEAENLEGLTKLIWYPPSGVLNIIGSITSIGKEAIEFAKEFINDKIIPIGKGIDKNIISPQISNFKQILDLALSDFSFGKFFDVSTQYPNNDLVSTVGKAFAFGQRIMALPIIGVGQIGRLMNKIYSGIIDAGKGAANDLVANTQKRLSAVSEGDLKTVVMGTTQKSEGNPLFALTTLIDYATRPFLIIPTLGAIVGNKISEHLGTIVETFSELGSNITTDQEELFKLATSDSGTNLPDTLLYAGSGDFGNHPIIANISDSLMQVSKIVWAPVSVVSGTFHAIKDGVMSIVNGFKQIGSNINNDQKAISDLAIKGDIAKTFSYAGISDINDNPLVTLISDGLMQVSKIVWAPVSVVSYLGHTVVDVVKSATEGAKNDYNSVKDTLSKMGQMANDGNIVGVLNTTTKYDPFDPIGDVFSAAEGIGKIFYSIVGVVNLIGEPIKNFLKESFGWLKDVGDYVDNKASSAWNSAKGKAGEIVSGIRDQWNLAEQYGARVFGAQGSGAGGSGFVSQHDSKYANMNIGGSSVYDMGCAPASAINALGKGNMSDAVSMANRYQTNGGTDISFFNEYFAKHGVQANYMNPRSAGGKEEMLSSIASGTPTVIMGRDSSNTSKSRSPFGPYNHDITIKGANSDGTLNVYDSENRGVKRYSSDILDNALAAVSAGSSRGKIIKFRPKNYNFRFYIGAGGGVREDETTKAVWAFLTSECGLSEAAAAGVMGNMQSESGISTIALNKSSGAFGLCQWLGGRKSNLQSFAKNLGKTETDLDVQLQFLKSELDSGGQWIRKANKHADGFYSKGMSYAEYKNIKDPQEAAVEFEVAFERGEGKDGNNKINMKGRIDNAIAYYNLFTGKHFAYKPPKGPVVNKVEGAANKTGSTVNGNSVSTSNNSSNTGSLGIMGTITGAFAKLSELFFGKQGTNTVSGKESIDKDENQEHGTQDSKMKITGDGVLGSSSASGDWVHNFPYFNQGDNPWASHMYGKKTIKESGCGPTSMAMVLKSYGINTDPIETADWSVAHGHRVDGAGTDHTFFNDIGTNMGLDPSPKYTDSNKAAEDLMNNIPVIASMKPGDFTKQGHFLVITGLDKDGKMVVNDPGSRQRTGNVYDKDFVFNQAKGFWSITKDGKGSLNKSKTPLVDNDNDSRFGASGSGISKLYRLGAGGKDKGGDAKSSKADVGKAFKAKKEYKLPKNIDQYKKTKDKVEDKDPKKGLNAADYLIKMIDQLNQLIKINAEYADANVNQMNMVIKGIETTSSNLVSGFSATVAANKAAASASSSKGEAKSSKKAKKSDASGDSSKKKKGSKGSGLDDFDGFDYGAGGKKKSQAKNRSYSNGSADLNQLKATIDMILAG